jgi:iron complex transport system substrate-binding protein
VISAVLLPCGTKEIVKVPWSAPTMWIVSTSALPDGLTPSEIDAFVVRAMAQGDDLYHLDEGALAELDADLVVTQDLCAVCAVDVSVVDDALAHLGCTAEVLTIDPHTLDQVLESILTLGRATGRLATAQALVADQRRRLGAAWRHSMGRTRPRVMFLEWTDPPFAPGHWIPEMIEVAGGEPLLATPGEKSRRVTWDQVGAAGPDVVVVAPCGFDRDGSQRLADELLVSGVLPAGVPVLAVDANASWARPGTRLPDGVEELGTILRALTARSPA